MSGSFDWFAPTTNSGTNSNSWDAPANSSGSVAASEPWGSAPAAVSHISDNFAQPAPTSGGDVWDSAPVVDSPWGDNAENGGAFDQDDQFQSSGSDFKDAFKYHDQKLPEEAPQVLAGQIGDELKALKLDDGCLISDNTPWASEGFVVALNIPENLKNGLNDMGITMLSKIQMQSLPAILAGNNVIAQSQSGTGKTITFLLGAFSKINTEENYPQVLIVVPTFELAQQVYKVGLQVGKHHPEARLRLVVRGERVSSGDQFTEHILIATIGKCHDCTDRLEAFKIDRLKMVVFDEADELISSEREESIAFVTYLTKSLSAEAQFVMFSATLTDSFLSFVETFCKEPQKFLLPEDEVALENIKQKYISVYSDNEKKDVLSQILKAVVITNCFVFCQTRADAHNVFETLQELGLPVGVIAGDLPTAMRFKTLNDFNEGTIRFLIATNVSARGLDVPKVSMVINYNLPYSPISRGVDFEAYLHRIGRCGRFGREGLAVSFADGPKSRQQIEELVSRFGKNISELRCDVPFSQLEEQLEF